MTADVYSEDGYFAIIPEWVLDADVSAQAIRLYAVLRRYADQRTMHAHPSRRVLAERLQVASVRTVDSALEDLIRIGAVDIIARYRDDGSRTSSGYLVRGRQKRHLHPPVQQTAQGAAADSTPPRQQIAQQEPEPENQSQELQLLPLDLTAEGRRPAAPPDLFEEFWTAYPRKVGKADARKVWQRVTRKTPPERIIAAVRGYPFDLSRVQFVPYPASWLNAGRWEDDPAALVLAAPSGNGHTPYRDPATPAAYTGPF